MKLFIVMFLSVISGCSDAADYENSIATSETCDISFKNSGPCVYKNISVKFIVKKISVDEKLLLKLDVEKTGQKFSLDISKDTSFLDGDKGYISFTDINFDSVPDISITTSFGLANLYMDYWVYDVANKNYLYIGNFTKFKINKSNKTLSNVVKISAAKYKNTVYMWKGLKLKEK